MEPVGSCFVLTQVAAGQRRGWPSAVGMGWSLLCREGSFGVVSGYLLSRSQLFGCSSES